MPPRQLARHKGSAFSTSPGRLLVCKGPVPSWCANMMCARSLVLGCVSHAAGSGENVCQVW